MSMIGEFGLCQRKTYENFVSLLKDHSLNELEAAVNNIQKELEQTSSELMNDKCSGNVFIALFEYFEEKLNIELHDEFHGSIHEEAWLNITGDLDFIVFSENLKYLVLGQAINRDEICQYVSEFYQEDCGEAGKEGCQCFFANLERADSDNLLIYHLY